MPCSQLGQTAGSSPGSAAPPDQTTTRRAMAHWDDGRAALNSFLATLNRVTGIERLTLIPADAATYPRSKSRYTQLVKDAATCRNRGGEALAGVWGQLMIYGTVPGVSPCGMTLAEYFSS